MTPPAADDLTIEEIRGRLVRVPEIEVAQIAAADGEQAPGGTNHALEHVLALAPGADLADVGTALRRFVASVNGADPLDRRVRRDQAIEALKERRIADAAGLVDAALGRPDPPRTPAKLVVDVTPAVEAQDGAALLDGIADYVAAYLFLPRKAAEAVAAWAVLTYLVGSVFHAPILAVLSATKRCGKTVLLDLLRSLVYRGRLTSAGGVTTAVLFRLNERDHPTLLIDEAEKLAGRHADQELVGLLNVGHRRGNTVVRCVERNGAFEIDDFDAFGFRCVAAIGGLWDTLIDRSIVIPLERMPRGATITRFRESTVTEAGQALARRIARWVQDYGEMIVASTHTAPRPDWLDPRACDNWAGLFAVAAVAGGKWPDLMQAAARSLQGDPDDEQDQGERLIHDIHQVFRDAASNGIMPKVIKSGELVTKLTEIETAPWGDYRQGRPLSTHGLAHVLKRFGVRPQQGRDDIGAVVRGYWLADLEAAFLRYPRPVPVVPVIPVVPLAAEGIEGEDRNLSASGTEE